MGHSNNNGGGKKFPANEENLRACLDKALERVARELPALTQVLDEAWGVGELESFESEIFSCLAAIDEIEEAADRLYKEVQNRSALAVANSAKAAAEVARHALTTVASRFADPGDQAA